MGVSAGSRQAFRLIIESNFGMVHFFGVGLIRKDAAGVALHADASTFYTFYEEAASPATKVMGLQPQEDHDKATDCCLGNMPGGHIVQFLHVSHPSTAGRS